jgi:DNA-directed RNA polymerase specialized sigma24 family protein
MQTDLPPPLAQSPPTGDELEAAFRQLHGPRLHGFALLLLLGDRATAARLSDAALSSAAGRVGELRHPERAAAWLRARVVRDARRSRRRRGTPAEREAAFTALGVDDAVLAGLEPLGVVERAGIIASSVERLDARDVATIVGRDGAALERLLRRARGRYLAAHARVAGDATMMGPIGEHLDAVATQAMR